MFFFLFGLVSFSFLTKMDIFSIIKTNLLLSQICGLSSYIIVTDFFRKSKCLQNYSCFILCLNTLFQLAYVVEAALYTPVKEIYAFLGSLDLFSFAVNSILTSFLLIHAEDSLNSDIVRINRIYIRFLMIDDKCMKKLQKRNILIVTFSIFIATIIFLYDVLKVAIVDGGPDHYISIKFFSMFFRSSTFAIFFMQFATYLLIISTSYKSVNSILFFLNEFTWNYKRKPFLFFTYNKVQFLKVLKNADNVIKDFHEKLNKTFSFYCAATSLCLFLELIYSSISYVKDDNRTPFDHASNVLWVSFFALQFISCIWACDFATYKVHRFTLFCILDAFKLA